MVGAVPVAEADIPSSDASVIILGENMKTIYKTVKYLFAFMVLCFALSGCGAKEDTEANSETSSETSSEISIETSSEISAETSSESSAVSETDEDSPYSDMKFGRFTLNSISENNAMVTLVVEEKVNDTLMEPELICAFKWDCTCTMFDYDKMEAVETDWDTFGDHLIDMDYSHYDEESGEYILEDGALRSIWAYYTVDEDGFMTNIEEVYIP